MKRVAGILGLFVAICLITMVINGKFVSETNLYNVIRWTALYGVISIGVAFVIITGGIDLSIGSVVALTGCLLALLLTPTFEDTGQTFKIKSIDRERNVLTLDKDASAMGHLDQLAYEWRGTPNQLDIDRNHSVENLNSVAVLNTSGLTADAILTWKVKQHMNIALALIIVMAVSIGIGLIHGLLITKLRLQPFVVTLCGLLIYRGVTRGISGDQNVGFGIYYGGLKSLASGQPFSIPLPGIKWISEGHWGRVKVKEITQADGTTVLDPVIHKAGEKMFTSDGSPLLDEAGQQVFYQVDTLYYLDFWGWVPIPAPMLIMIALAIAAAIFLNKTIYGRYLLALGRNEKAAQYSGINTHRMVIMAYIICSALAGLGGILFVLDINSVQPSSHGSYYELYAIAAAVLGGCSLRGGEGTILGVVIGAALIRTLRNATNLIGIPTRLEFAILGGVILIGVIADEVVKRAAAKRRAIREAQMATADAAKSSAETSEAK